MAKYELELSARAIVSAKITIEAQDEKEAHKKLLELIKGKMIDGGSNPDTDKIVSGLHNCPWEYNGLDLNPELKIESFRKEDK